MKNNKETSAIIDGLLCFLAMGGVISVGLLAPNMVQILDKPLQQYLKNLDERSRERELRRITTYMKRQGLIKITSEDYEHGLELTEAGRWRAEKTNLENMAIAKPESWDQIWRIVLYDIPEARKNGRDALTRKLRELGFKQLQKSVWIHPFPCRLQIEAVSVNYALNKYVTYIETDHIDKQKLLIDKFKHLL